jgi:hypothetical protein
MNEDVFTAPGFVARVHQWARETVVSRGLHVAAPIGQFHVRPWSSVFRVQTETEALFLKCCGPTQSHEPRLTELLHRAHPGVVPNVLAVHPNEPWMLVADGGRRVDEVYRGVDVLDAWRAVLPRYAELQRALTPKATDALAVGTPDHGTRALVAGFMSAIEAEPTLDAGRGDRLTEDERRALERALPEVQRACDDLASLGIADTVQHDDLHQGNLLVRDGRAVVFDWGDACVSHPFLTLAVTLRFAASLTGLAPDDDRILTLREAYLEPWRDRAGAEELRAGAGIARRLGELSRTLTWHVVARTYPGVVDHYPGGVAGSLRRVLRLFS